MSETANREANITLEDVETAIRVLNAFIRQSQKATRILRSLESSQGGRGGFNMSFNDIMGLAFREAKARQELAQSTPSGTQEGQEPELTQEELTRMREIADKQKKEKVTPSPHRGY